MSSRLQVPLPITALIGGVTEPAIYGILLKYKKPLIMVCIANAVGGAICGAFNVTRNVQNECQSVDPSRYLGGLRSLGNCCELRLFCVLVFALVWLFGTKTKWTMYRKKKASNT